MELGQRCIQSFAPHGVEFLDKELLKSGVRKVLLMIPAGFIEKNFVLATEQVLEALKDDPTFKTLIETKTIRLLDKVPEKYIDPVDTLQVVRGNLMDAKKEAGEAKVKVDTLASENEALKARIAELENGGAVETKTELSPEDKVKAIFSAKE